MSSRIPAGMNRTPEQFRIFSIEWLMVGLLTGPVDHGVVRYQRNQGKNGKPGTGLKTRWKKYGEFNPAYVRLREVSRRSDGTYAVMDGNGSNHWMEEQFGYEFLVPCKVYEGLSEVQEATMFLGFQNMKQVSRAEEFVAGQVAEDSAYVIPGKIAAEYGFTIGNGRKNAVIGYSAIEYVFTSGESRLRETLEFINKSFPDDPSRTHGMFVMALCDILGNHDLNRAVLSTVLASPTVNELREYRTGGAARKVIFGNIMNLYRIATESGPYFTGY